LSDIEEGTELILFFKDSIKKTLDFEKFLIKIKHYIRDIEIPITVEYRERKEIISQESYDIDPKTELNNRLTFFHQNRRNELTCLSIKLINENYKGFCYTIVPIDDKQTVIPRHIENWFRTESRFRFGENKTVNVLYKGMFVEEFKDLCLKNIFGTINILSEDKLSLNRSEFLNRKKFLRILEEFELGLIKKIFKTWNKLPNETKFDLSKRFIDTTFESIGVFREVTGTVYDFLQKELYCRFFDNGKLQFSSFKELTTRYEKIMIYYTYGHFRTGDFDLEILEKLSLSFKIPLLILIDDLHSPFVESLINCNLFSKEIVSDDDSSYLFINFQKCVERKSLFFLDEVVEFSDKYFCTFIQEKLYFNNIHPFVKFLLTNQEKINSDQIGIDLLKEFDETLSTVKYGFENKLDLTKLNNILTEINKRYKLSFSIQKDDFPPWFQNFISNKGN